MSGTTKPSSLSSIMNHRLTVHISDVVCHAGQFLPSSTSTCVDCESGQIKLKTGDSGSPSLFVCIDSLLLFVEIVCACASSPFLCVCVQHVSHVLLAIIVQALPLSFRALRVGPRSLVYRTSVIVIFLVRAVWMVAVVAIMPCLLADFAPIGLCVPFCFSPCFLFFSFSSFIFIDFF